MPVSPPPTVLPGVSRRVLVATKEFPRFSEGDVVELSDGRLLLAVARKEGAGDFATGTIIGMFSLDGGLSWDDAPHAIRKPWDDVIDVMSVSFARTRRGLHLFFLGRGRKATSDTRVYQMISSDEGRTWGEPVRVSGRDGYHVVNNARVLRRAKGRLIVPAAWVPGDIGKSFQDQRVFCYLSDDDGVTWRESNEVALAGKALMEPGVAECADGSIYMTIRTGLGHLYEARSRDGGETWADFRATELAAPAAPSTVAREPGGGGALWMFWCDNAKGGWKGRNRIMFAASADHGRTWGPPRFVEEDPRGSFGYTSVTFVKGHALLTYYDWRDHGQPGFAETSLRERLISVGWFKGEVTPPVFRTAGEPVLRADRAGEGRIVSMNSGLLVEEGRWRLWYTNGALGPIGERLRVCYAESKDAGRTWVKAEENVVLPAKGETTDFYHASVHRASDRRIVMFVWRNGGDGESGMWRYVSEDNGRTFAASPERALIAAWFAKDAVKAAAGAGRESNDAFDVVRNNDGSYAYFAACVRKATDPRQVIKHDNAAGWVRLIGHASSPDGVTWTPTEIVIESDHGHGDPWDEQFYGMQVFRYRGFWLGLLFTFHAESQVIQPEWAWSHNGVNWARTRTPCAPLGDEGRFDSRMLLFGSVVVTAEEVVWMYSGYDWRHNAFKKGEVGSAIGRAVLPRKELDSWLDTLAAP
ncbi:MAG: nanB [Phycisphaerales bacterium]|nr:nanB [Phycisphaerales bacterium]